MRAWNCAEHAWHSGEVPQLEERPEEAGRGALTLSGPLVEVESPESPRGGKRSERGPAFGEVRGILQSAVSWSQDAAAGGGGDWLNPLLLRDSRRRRSRGLQRGLGSGFPRRSGRGGNSGCRSPLKEFAGRGGEK